MGQKIVVNRCYGGFSISRKAVEYIAKKQGRPCYWFTTKPGDLDTLIPCPKDTDDIYGMRSTAFDIPNPQVVLAKPKKWLDMTMDERIAHNKLYEKHSHENRPENRADPLLVEAVEKLGKKSWGWAAELEVVEIPDGVEWEIDEYDGMEKVAEKHRVW